MHATVRRFLGCVAGVDEHEVGDELLEVGAEVLVGLLGMGRVVRVGVGVDGDEHGLLSCVVGEYRLASNLMCGASVATM